MTESESVALPLGDAAIFSCRRYYSKKNHVCQEVFAKKIILFRPAANAPVRYQKNPRLLVFTRIFVYISLLIKFKI